MQNWTPEIWQAGLVGLIIGYLFLRFTKDSVKKQVKTETELQKVKNQLDLQKQELEKHFAESAELLKNIAQDYQKLYTHLATSSTQLLPELTNKPLFSQELIGQHTTEQPLHLSSDEQPRDYSEGSSGLLKDKKLTN